jgi:purine-binding chemotaxis protein CheW
VPARVRDLVTMVCKLDRELLLILDTEKAASLSDATAA